MKIYRKLKTITVISLSIFFIGFLSIGALGLINRIPTEFNISVGDEIMLQAQFPIKYSMISDNLNKILEINELHSEPNEDGSLRLKSITKGSTDLQVKILGLIPYRTVKVNVIPKIEVVPGGESIGVKLNTDGALIIGLADIVDERGNSHNIAANSGIKIGDTLIKINDIKVKNAAHISEIIKNSNGDEVVLTIKRNDKEFKATVIPIQSQEDGQYRLGLWVRDKTAGVGTLSFFHMDSGKFGALGHAITDIDTGALLSVKNGEIIKSKVVSIEEGKRGKPGEIRGVFYETSNPIGKLEKNTPLGVYGQLFSNSFDNKYKKPMPIAYQHEIKEGPAYILTTLDHNKIEKFDVEITKVNFQTKAEGKSMIIKVTDKNLLERTGGIIQGMSGSPIIQNDKVVGAITHVLVNDPTKGYGIFIEWMVSEAGINDKNR